MTRRLRTAHHHIRPALTVATEASGDAALDALVDALVVARAEVVRRDERSATLRLGSFLRSWVFSDSMLLDVVPRTRTWGMRATVDLRVEQGAPPTRVRVTMTRVDEHRWTVPHLLDAIEGAARTLRDRGHATEVGEVGPG